MMLQNRVLSICVVASLFAYSSIANGQSKSNVIVIVSDDGGYSDFGFARRGLGDASTNFRDPENGLTIASLTPNLDALAMRGVTLSRAYVAANCQPTRAAILTGGYQQRTGNENVGNNNYLQSEVFEGIPNNVNTIWDRMKSQGYTTGAVGKWHVGSIEDSVEGAFDGNRPQNQGIDEFRGIWHGSRSYTVGSVGNNPNSKANQTQQLREAIATHDANGNVTGVTTQSLEQAHAGEYITNTFGEFATDFIGDHANQADPFMLYQSFTAPHKPWNNSSPDFDDDKIDGMREASYRRQVASLQITMDKEIGNILAKLEDPNGDLDTSDSIVDDTLIIFVNDNGGVSGRDPFTGEHAVDNGPFTGHKGSMLDGGIRVPMIIAGAGVDASKHGTIYDKAVHGVDILPTALAAGQGTIGPEETNIDGVNLLPFINGVDAANPHEVILNKWQGSFAVIKDKGEDQWKLVNTQRNPNVNYNNRENQYRLYNTKTDVGEETNLINVAGNADLVSELKRDLTKHEATFDKGRFAILARKVDDDLSNSFAEEGRNVFDHFVFNPNGGNQNWSATDGWLAKDGEDNIPNSAAKLPTNDPNYSPGKSMYLSDSFAGAIVEFGTSDTSSYVANNDMFRQTGGDYMLNKVVLSGEFAGSADQTGEIAGNKLIFTNDLNGNAPEIAIDANQTGSNGFDYTISNELVLFDDLSITGDGDVDVTISGAISDYYSEASADYDANSVHNSDSAFGARGITKQGTSKVALTGQNTYTGKTQIEAGTLALANNGSIDQSSRIEIHEGATLDATQRVGGEMSIMTTQVLAGTGLLEGDVVAESGSIIQPGFSFGKLTIDGDLTVNDGAVFDFEIGRGGLTAIAGVDYDQLVVTGGLFEGALNIEGGDLLISSDDAFAIDAGENFDILAFGSIGSTFSFDMVSLPTLRSGVAWDTSELLTLGRISTVVAVPEPGTFAVLGLIASGAAMCRRRSQSRSGDSV